MSEKMFTVGRCVKIHSLASAKAKKHNGKTCVVKSPINDETGRCGIQPVGMTKILAVKPSNLTILCSFCKKKDVQIVCERCQSASYCSQECKEKHWKGSNIPDPETGLPISHEGWCIPIQFEMEVPTRAIMDSHVGEHAYEYTTRYLKVASGIGNSGRTNEERVMLEKLLEVDPAQPAAYHNLFGNCQRLAAYAERYHPEELEEFESKAIRYLGMGIDLTVSNAGLGENLQLEGDVEQILKAWVVTAKERGLEFIEECMRGKRGEGHPELLDIQMCLENILLLFEQRNESTYRVHEALGFCCQKLKLFADAIDHFERCCECSKDQQDKQQTYHVALMQIPQCLMSMALYRKDKTPAERVDLLEQAVTKSTVALAVLKAEDPAKSYMCQSKLCRILFNQNQVLNLFALNEGIEYLPEQKKIMRGVMHAMGEEALRGALAAGDQSELKEIRDVQKLPFL